jgi:very-short-patch-repair endonuclease
MRRKKRRQKSSNTKPELLFKSILDVLNIEYKQQYHLQKKIYDFYIPSKNLLVEIDGTYWHGKDLSFFDMNMIQRKAFRNDLRKNGIAAVLGYQMLRLWEGEINLKGVKKLLNEIKDVEQDPRKPF